MLREMGRWGKAMDLEDEERHLRLADDHLRKSAARIQAHENRIKRMETQGFDTEMALTLLILMREAQQLMLSHREQIVEAIEQKSRSFKSCCDPGSLDRYLRNKAGLIQ